MSDKERIKELESKNVFLSEWNTFNLNEIANKDRLFEKLKNDLSKAHSDYIELNKAYNKNFANLENYANPIDLKHIIDLKEENRKLKSELNQAHTDYLQLNKAYNIRMSPNENSHEYFELRSQLFKLKEENERLKKDFVIVSEQLCHQNVKKSMMPPNGDFGSNIDNNTVPSHTLHCGCNINELESMKIHDDLRLFKMQATQLLNKLNSIIG